MKEQDTGAKAPSSPIECQSSSRNRFPQSELFDVKTTPNSGRGVFARQHIPANTILLRTAHVASSVIYADYAREVCHQCFAYDRGKHWKLRDVGRGLVFCSNGCQQEWLDSWHQISRTSTCEPSLTKDMLEARERVQAQIVKMRGKPHLNWLCLEGGDDDAQRQPAAAEVERVWAETEVRADLVRIARGTLDADHEHQHQTTRSVETSISEVVPLELTKPKAKSKIVRKAFREAQGLKPDADTVWYLLEGILYHACSASAATTSEDSRSPQSIASNLATESPTTTDTPDWAIVTSLASSNQAYKTIVDLHNHCTAYLILLATLPTSLLTSVTQSVVRTIQARSIHNIFGIRSLDEGHMTAESTSSSDANIVPAQAATSPLAPGSECLGYALYPYASYWNHSCNPNLSKQREGREWRFWTSRDVNAGEELCISYLGGDERTVDVIGRRTLLEESWGFVCACKKCYEETGTSRDEVASGAINLDTRLALQ